MSDPTEKKQIRVIIHANNGRAIRVTNSLTANRQDIWLPLSLINIGETREDGTTVISITQAFARSRGLIA